MVFLSSLSQGIGQSLGFEITLTSFHLPLVPADVTQDIASTTEGMTAMSPGRQFEAEDRGPGAGESRLGGRYNPIGMIAQTITGA